MKHRMHPSSIDAFRKLAKIGSKRGGLVGHRKRVLRVWAEKKGKEIKEDEANAISNSGIHSESRTE